MNLQEHDEESWRQVAVISVPFPAQGHLNQLLQISCLISSYSIPVHYVGSAIHNRQAKLRINGLNPQHVSKIHFHDIPTPPFDSPPPDPNSTNKFPAQLQPAWDAALNLRHPVADYLREMAAKFTRVVVLHDFMNAAVVQDIASIPNAESYAVNTISAFSKISYICEGQGKPFPIQHPKELPSFEGLISDDIMYFVSLQSEALTYRAGDIYNTCRLIEAPYMKVLESEELIGNKKSWAIGPIFPAKLSSDNNSQHKCIEWLDIQEPKSVIYVSFGTTISLSDEQINELALGLEQSKVKFLWVLRDADKGDVFDGELRRAQLPEGFEDRVEGVGIVVRDRASPFKKASVTTEIVKRETESLPMRRRLFEDFKRNCQEEKELGEKKVEKIGQNNHKEEEESGIDSVRKRLENVIVGDNKESWRKDKIEQEEHGKREAKPQTTSEAKELATYSHEKGQSFKPLPNPLPHPTIVINTPPNIHTHTTTNHNSLIPISDLLTLCQNTHTPILKPEQIQIPPNPKHAPKQPIIHALHVPKTELTQTITPPHDQIPKPAHTLTPIPSLPVPIASIKHQRKPTIVKDRRSNNQIQRFPQLARKRKETGMELEKQSVKRGRTDMEIDECEALETTAAAAEQSRRTQ